MVCFIYIFKLGIFFRLENIPIFFVEKIPQKSFQNSFFAGFFKM